MTGRKDKKDRLTDVIQGDEEFNDIDKNEGLDKRQKITVAVSVLLLFAIAAAVVCVAVKKLTPGKDVMSLEEYYNIPEGEAMIIMDDAIYEQNALIYDGMAYIDLDTIIEYFDDRYYWDSYENLLVYTTPSEIIKTETASKYYSVNKTRRDTSYVTVKVTNGKVYVAAEYIKLFSNFNYTMYEAPYRLIIDHEYVDYLYADVTKATQIRTAADIKSEILKEVAVGEKLMFIDNKGAEEKGFVRVMTEDGVRGYVKKKYISATYYDTKTSNYETPVYSNITKNYRINLVWHQVTNEQANDNMTSLLDSTKGVTTISPTWFRVDSVEGTLSSLASEDYVERAHSRGVEVWALVDNFDTSVDCYELLSRTSRRERLVNEIIAAAIKYNLDGINIDFESLTSQTGVHYIEFLRELSVKCRSNQIVLSVDNYVPASYNMFYDLEEQGEIIDYVIIMAYDEHHSKSEEAGSVASIGFVTNAVNDTLKYVDKEKMIIGMPFYTRLWKAVTENGQTSLTSEALGMANAKSVLSKNGITAAWDENTAQYYAEYESGGAVYKIWLEESESIEEKLNVIFGADAAGVACWRLGFENSEVWDVILKYVN